MPESNELVRIFSRPVGDEANSVDARELHSTLGAGRDFPTWIRSRIDSLELVEGIDFAQFHHSPDPGNGRPMARVDYALTLDAAKHIALAERSEMGRKVRAYFIEAEKRLRAITVAPALPDLRDPEQVATLLAHSLTVLTEERTKRLAAESALADAAPKVDFVDRYVAARGNVGLRLASKILGQRQHDFIEWLIARGFVYRTTPSKSRRSGKERTGIILPYAGFEEYFEVKTLITEHEDGDRQRQQTMITPLGITWLAKKLGVEPDMEAA